jgi:serine/threonine-protein kinase
VKVLDFGISKVTGLAAAGELSITDTGAVLGSPLYMSPEQMRSSKNTDVRTDVWSLGVILFELLSGQVPFDGETVTELCLRVVQDPPRSLVELSPELPPDLVTVVMRCLEKERNMRFGSVAELAMALEPFAEKKRSGRERAWRSLADTARSQDFGAPRPAGDASSPAAAQSGASGAAEKASTHATWDAPGLARTERRRGFVGGIAAGAAFAVVGLVVGLGLSGKLGGKVDPPAMSNGSVAQPPAKDSARELLPPPPPVVSMGALPPASPEPTVVAVTSASAPKPNAPGARTRPGTRATAAASAPPPGEPQVAVPPTSSPNGAPILR